MLADRSADRSAALGLAFPLMLFPASRAAPRSLLDVISFSFAPASSSPLLFSWLPQSASNNPSRPRAPHRSGPPIPKARQHSCDRRQDPRSASPPETLGP